MTEQTVLGTILMPTDGSEPADAAGRHGFQLVVQLDVTVRTNDTPDTDE